MHNALNKQAFNFKELHMGLPSGDVINALRILPSDCFNTVITSPPYFWVRDYGVEGQIGHEASVDDFINKLADVFDEVKRVLHPHGVFYLNIGDTYYSGNGQPHGEDPRSKSRNFMRKKMRPVDQLGWAIPKKSLIGIPWKIAFEMQRRDWTLRSDIIWMRTKTFSEPSARDRPWRQHEHVFLFSKNRFYSYDRNALEGSGDVWHIPIERAKINREHNAPFPVKLVEKCIATGSPPGGWVLDPFVGSGTTLMTSLQMGRNCVGIDIKTEYISELKKNIINLGSNKEQWSLLNSELIKPCSALENWSGHLTNMRKPGSSKLPTEKDMK